MLIIYENAGTGNNFEQLKPQTRDKIQNAYSVKVAEVRDNTGGFQIEPTLSPQQTIQQIKAEADNLKFSDKSAAIYHVEKHYEEFPPSHKKANIRFNNYWQSSVETIKKSTNVTSFYDQLTGNRSFIFKHTYEEQSKPYYLQTIVNVSRNGIVEIRTYFNFKNK